MPHCSPRTECANWWRSCKCLRNFWFKLHSQLSQFILNWILVHRNNRTSYYVSPSHTPPVVKDGAELLSKREYFNLMISKQLSSLLTRQCVNQIEQIIESLPVHHENKPVTCYFLFADLSCLCHTDVTFHTRLPKPFVAPIERLEPSLCRYRCYVVRGHFPTIGNNTVGEARIL